jgi:hypothetical protein
MPSIHDVQITVNAENCCNGCCIPRRRRRNQKAEAPKQTDEKVQKTVRRVKSNPT